MTKRGGSYGIASVVAREGTVTWGKLNVNFTNQEKGTGEIEDQFPDNWGRRVVLKKGTVYVFVRVTTK